MKEYRLTPAARLDLSTIWDYTHEHWDARQAELYVVEIREAIERVAAEPERGRRCDEIREGYRRYAIGSHVIFYREHHDAIHVVRILHQRMDSMRHL